MIESQLDIGSPEVWAVSARAYRNDDQGYNSEPENTRGSDARRLKLGLRRVFRILTNYQQTLPKNKGSMEWREIGRRHWTTPKS